jgi:hypothetical protein
LAEHLDQRSDPQITISRVRRSTSVTVIGGKRVAAQPFSLMGTTESTTLSLKREDGGKI